MLALGRFQGRGSVECRRGWRFQFSERNVQVWALGQDHGALDQILELPDIAGPMVLRKSRHRPGRNRLDPLAHQAGILLREVADEQGNVFRSRPQ